MNPEPIRLVSEEYDNDLCSICHVDIENTDTSMYTVPYCEHTFHNDCIITWFRMGNTTCPYCRSEPQQHVNQPFGLPRYIAWGDRKAIYTFKKNYASKANAPKQLKSLLRRLQKFERKQKDGNKLLSEWRKNVDGLEWKRLRKIYKQFHLKKSKRLRKVRELKASIQNYPIIPAVVRLV